MQVLNAKNAARAKIINGRVSRSLQEDYNQKRRDCNKICRKKKKEIINKRIEEIEEYSKTNQAKQFYKNIDWFRKDYKPRLSGCKDKQGNILGEEQEIMTRWTEYYRELLNKESQITTSSTEVHLIQTAEPLISKPSMAEVKKATLKMKNYKAPGEDNITAEMLKNAGTRAEKELYEIISEIWDEETIPEAWNMGIISSVYKKGDKRDCANYRGITLLNIAYKVFSNILLSRLSAYAEEIIGEYQCGFRRGRGTTDQIFIVRQSLEKCYEYTTDLHMLFIDFKQAFDSIVKESLFMYMEQKGIPKKLVRLIKMTLINAKARVLVDGYCGEEFNLNRGVRQGDALSATLFNLTLHCVLESIVDNGIITYKSKHLCAYADDIVIMARNINELKEVFLKLISAAQQLGLEINCQKTKYMIISAEERRRHRNNITVENMTFENVDSFVYLGSEINNRNKFSSDI